MNNPNVYYTCKDTGTKIVDGPRGGYDVVYNGTPILNLPQSPISGAWLIYGWLCP